MSNPWGAGVAIDRKAFDNAIRNIAQDAGVTIFPGTLVRNVERKNSLWHVMLEGQTTRVLRAYFLVLATGRGRAGLIPRISAAQSSKLALMTRLRTERVQEEHTLYLEATDSGWWYSLPDIRGGRFIGFCVGHQKIKRCIPLPQYFIQELRRTRLLINHVSGILSFISVYGRSANMEVYSKVAGKRWLAVGDAAFAPDPLSGMGIEFTVESSILAARVVQAISDLPCGSALSDLALLENRSAFFRLGPVNPNRHGTTCYDERSPHSLCARFSWRRMLRQGDKTRQSDPRSFPWYR